MSPQSLPYGQKNKENEHHERETKEKADPKTHEMWILKEESWESEMKKWIEWIGASYLKNKGIYLNQKMVLRRADIGFQTEWSVLGWEYRKSEGSGE